MHLPSLFTRQRGHKMLGIDIAYHAIKVVLAHKSASAFTVEKALNFPILEATPTAIAALLREELSACEFKKAKAVIAVPDNFVMTKTIMLPGNLTALEIEEHLLLEAEHYFGCPATDICLDFVSTSALSTELQQVQIVAAKRAEIEWRKSILQLAGFSLQAIDVAGAALIRAAQFFCHHAAVAVLYFSEHQAQLLITAPEKLWQEKSLPLESHNLIAEIKQQLLLLTHPPAALVIMGEHAELEFLTKELTKALEKPVKIFNVPAAEYGLSFGLALWDYYEN